MRSTAERPRAPLILVIDLNDPDPLPLREWLSILKRIRVRHEVACGPTINAAAKRLGVTRQSIYRII